VASPHKLAALQPGERVVDLGSGLGIDSFIAAAAVGEAGRVVGVDIAEKEVRHAQARASARGVGGRVDFMVGDLERLPLPAASADCVISNGAFCLAPSKPAAFAEVYRVLKPGGRFSIATSVILTPLEDGTWPLCMQMFSELATLAPIAKAAGFASVGVDTSDMAMQFEVDTPEASGSWSSSSSSSSRRNQVHVGSSEFSHLKELDLNAICGRVVISGVKPA
jgi:SAM-dependent methyltransferase